MDDNKYCCALFMEHLAEAGRRGFAIIPFENPSQSGNYFYFLQSRTADYDEIKTTRHITIDRVISYCPWCGTILTDVTRRNREVIAEMARRNRHLIKI